jgi:TRAP-type mannitol/chloroaromatic compound transport system permease small subunit
MTTTVRIIANTLMALLILFIVHRYLMFWHAWPNTSESFALVFAGSDGVETGALWQAYCVLLAYLIALISVIWVAVRQRGQSLLVESDRYAGWSAYVIRFAFWSVFLVGIVDTTISTLRIENALVGFIGPDLDAQLGQARFRALNVHYPLLALAAVIAGLTKNLSMIWLAFLVVLAEFSIVLSRFIFSYEQAYMGDLVRFWYAALFLFASAYTLVEEGHVRVDVLYAGMGKRSKAWVNTFGSLLLGIPLCFTILVLGMESRQSSLSSPIINFEISQSAYGLFVKYLMAGFLIIFAVSMAMQFISYFLRSSAVLIGDTDAVATAQGEH